MLPHARGMLFACLLASMFTLFTLLTAVTTQEAEASASVEGQSCGRQIKKPNGTPWVCTFSDTFRGSGLDPAKWTPLVSAVQAGHRDECRVDSPKNIKVKDGKLRLIAKRGATEVTCTSASGPFQTRNTTGAVTTGRKFSQKYGRVQIRAKMPGYRGAGFHSAMWMYPQDPQYGGWPASGEIDINEYRTGLFGRAVPTLHWLRDGEYKTATDWDCRVRRPQDFHNYVLVWNRHRIKFLYDGHVCLVHRFAKPKGETRQPFDQPFFLILNQSIGFGPNAPNESTPNRARMVIDRVRVWR